VEPLELLLDTESRQARLVFAYPSDSRGIGGPLIDGSLWVGRGPLRLEYRFVCYGYDLAEFAAALRGLHADFGCPAEFANQEGTVRVRLGPGGGRRGRVPAAVGVELLGEGCGWAELGGFAVEQSYLPGLAASAERFLAESGVDLTHPMLRG
jgi:hypothetical protein